MGVFTSWFPAILALQIVVLWTSVLVDVIIGDPPNRYHPVRWMGNYIEFFSRLFRKLSNSVISGFFFLLFVIISLVLVTTLIQWISLLQLLVYIAASALILKFTFALRSMSGHIRPVLEDIVEGRMDDARTKLSMIVRRPTSELDQPHMISACIETVSEGFVDGFATAVLFYGVAGLPGSVATRAINTLDSMIGYRDDLNINFGKASAVADTIVNFLPARLSALLFLGVAKLLGLKPSRSSLRLESSGTESVNAGWSMGAMALALGVRLEKPGHYCLNPGGREPDMDSAIQALRVYHVSVILVLLIATAEILFADLFLLI